MPADLHLVIGPAHEVQCAVGPADHAVAGPVVAQSASHDEGPRGQVRLIEIARSQARPGDQQLPGLPVRAARPARVDDVDHRLRHRSTDGDPGQRVVRSRIDDVVGRVDGRLGRPVQVDQALARPEEVEPAAYRPRRQGLTADVDPAQTRQVRGCAAGGDPPLGGAQEVLPQGGHRAPHGDAAALDQREQAPRIAHPVPRRGDHRRADQQRCQQLPDRRVEADRGGSEHPVGRAVAEGVDRPVQVGAQRTVRDRHAFRSPGRPRGEDDVREVIGRRADRRPALGVVRAGLHQREPRPAER